MVGGNFATRKVSKFIYFLQLIGDAQEKIRKDEENVVTVQVREEMTKNEIMELVYQKVNQELPLKEEVTSNICIIL